MKAILFTNKQYLPTVDQELLSLDHALGYEAGISIVHPKLHTPIIATSNLNMIPIITSRTILKYLWVLIIEARLMLFTLLILLTKCNPLLIIYQIIATIEYSQLSNGGQVIEIILTQRNYSHFSNVNASRVLSLTLKESLIWYCL